MSPRTLEIRQITPPALDFSPEDLRQILVTGDPSEHRLKRMPEDTDTRVASLRTRPDLVLRWMDVEHPSLLWMSRRNHLNPIERHLEVFETELGRLAAGRAQPYRKIPDRITVPDHTTFLVPNDPYDEESRDVLYTAVKRLGSPKLRPTSKDEAGRWLKRVPQDLEYRTLIAALTLAAKYYLGESKTGYYLGDLYGAEQYTSDLEVMDFDPILTGEVGRQQGLRNILEDLEDIHPSLEHSCLRITVEEALRTMPHVPFEFTD